MVSNASWKSAPGQLDLTGPQREAAQPGAHHGARLDAFLDHRKIAVRSDIKVGLCQFKRLLLKASNGLNLQE